MNDDPYKILGVARDASQEDIRKAYRKLAKELHPDLHPGDKEAESRFKKVSVAYNLLKDPEQRARYDRGEIDASGAERYDQGFYRPYAEADETGRYTTSAGFGDFEDISDLFEGLFTRRRGHAPDMRGRDMRYQLEVDFLDAVNGAKRRITLPDGNALDLAIPAGTRDGAVLRLKGKGGPGMGKGPPGDALVEIGVRPHRFFRREGNDIVMDLPVTVDEAVLGARVEVPTVSGRVSMKVPRGANTGDVLRLKGKGVKPPRGAAGDQRVILKVMLPKRIDSELESFMEEWRGKHQYDPRAGLWSAS
ncbi:MAG: DnaJ C-terminal domain-containing protein [Alphaproteobacteria bacterium]